MNSQPVSIRFRKAEYDYLRAQPGENISEKVRALLHKKSIADTIALDVKRHQTEFLRKHIGELQEKLERQDQRITQLQEEISRQNVKLEAQGQTLEKYADYLKKIARAMIGQDKKK